MLDAVSSKEAQRLAGVIEGLGYSTLWIPETIGRDPFVTATLLLSATSDLKIATGIANIYARDALTMANTQKSLEEAFPGRFLLGLGVSHHHLVDRVRHHDYSKPYSYMVDYLADMDKALFMAVGPSERPTTVLAALGPKMLQLAADRRPRAPTPTSSPSSTRRRPASSSAPIRCCASSRWWCSTPTASGPSPPPGPAWRCTSGRRTT